MTPHGPLKLAILLPVHNEDAALPSVLDNLIATMNEGLGTAHYEIHAIDDGSRDGSSRILAEYLKAKPGVPLRVTTVPCRSGYGRTLRTATAPSTATHIAWTDADGTYCATDLLRLYQEALSTGAQQVIGARSRDHGRYGAARFYLKRIAASFAGMLWRRSVPDLNSGLRVFTRQSAEAWLHLVPSGFSCTTTATLGALRAGQSVRFLPIQYGSRREESASKFRTIRDSYLLCVQILRLRFYT